MRRIPYWLILLQSVAVANVHHNCTNSECVADISLNQTVKVNKDGGITPRIVGILKANSAEMDRKSVSSESSGQSQDYYKYKKTIFECVSSGIDVLTGDYVVRIPGQKVRDINRLGRFLNLDSQVVLSVSKFFHLWKKFMRSRLHTFYL